MSAEIYTQNAAFYWKMILVLLAGTNIIYLQSSRGRQGIPAGRGKQMSRTRAKARDYMPGGAASIYIIDTHGTFVHQERGDGRVYTNIHTAMLKAQTALQTRQPTSIRAAQLRNDPSGAPRQLMQFGFFTNSGGIPIVVDGEMIGAIGVGGGDENCAIEGLKAVFGDRVLLPVYPQQKDSPQR